MLWSDPPEDEPSPESRALQERLCRAWRLLAVLALLGVALLLL